MKRVHVEQRVNQTVNRLNKTKAEKHPDLQAEKLQYEKEQRAIEREKYNQRMAEEEKQRLEWQKEKESRDYSTLFAGQSNQRYVPDEEDFM